MEIRLCSFRDQVVAGMMEHLLLNHGLHPRPLNIASHVSLAGAGLWYDIWIPKEEDMIARKIIIEAGYENALQSNQ